MRISVKATIRSCIRISQSVKPNECKLGQIYTLSQLVKMILWRKEKGNKKMVLWRKEKGNNIEWTKSMKNEGESKYNKNGRMRF